MAPTPRQADELLRAHLPRAAEEWRPLAASRGHFLRQEVLPERDNPPFDRVCMDGIAIASGAYAAGARRFPIVGTQAAGAVPQELDDPLAAIEVMTGAVLPRGTDCVVPIEEYRLDRRVAVLPDNGANLTGRNVQRRGSDGRPDAPMLAAGQQLGPAELAVVASAGLAGVRVSRQPRIAVVSTGDELVEPGQPIEAHQVRRSNAYAVVAACRAHGYATVDDEHLRDDPALLHARIGAQLETHEVLILSGGVSKGRYDFIPSVLQQLGVNEVFHQVEQRPGRPMWFGTTTSGKAVFGLPGNPVSTLVCLRRYVLPALEFSLSGRWPAVERIALAAAEDAPRKATVFLPVMLGADAAGLAVALARPPRGSGDFLALAGTAGFVELPPRAAGHPHTAVVDLYRW